MSHSEVSPWVVRGLYLFALVLVASPLADLASTVWPMRPTDLPWRYGFLGLGAGYLHTPILGLTLAMMVAWWTDDPSVTRAVGIVMLASSLVLLIAMGMFMLDVLQMRGLREPEMRQAVLVGGLLQELKYGTGLLVLAALGFGSVRTAARQARSPRSAGGRSHRIVAG
jgi:hypothetical protein